MPTGPRGVRAHAVGEGLERLVGVEKGAALELGPDAREGFVVAAAVVVFVGEEYGEARVGVRGFGAAWSVTR